MWHNNILRELHYARTCDVWQITIDVIWMPIYIFMSDRNILTAESIIYYINRQTMAMGDDYGLVSLNIGDPFY